MVRISIIETVYLSLLLVSVSLGKAVQDNELLSKNEEIIEDDLREDVEEISEKLTNETQDIEQLTTEEIANEEIENLLNVENTVQENEDQPPVDMTTSYYWFTYDVFIRQSWFQQTYPSAVFVGVAVLEDARLDFTEHYDPFGGGIATACPMCGRHIYGVVYEVDEVDYNALGRQNPQVQSGYRKVVTNPVILIDDETAQIVPSFLTEVACPKQITYGLPLPIDRLPSYTYLKELLRSYLDVDIPDFYIRSVAEIGNNGLIVEDMMAVQSEKEEPNISEEDDIIEELEQEIIEEQEILEEEEEEQQLVDDMVAELEQEVLEEVNR